MPYRTAPLTLALLALLALTACNNTEQHPTVLGPFLYFETNYVIERPGVRLDEDGIPEQHYSHLGWVRNPLTVTRWGLAEYSRYLSERRRKLRAEQITAAIKAADWLLENQREDGAWEYSFPWNNGVTDMPPPWISSIQQGMAISLLARVAEHTGKPEYLEGAALALRPFQVHVNDGGLVDEFDGVGPTLEEYPAPGNSSYVLNGWLFALVALHELHTLTGDDAALELFTASEAAVRELLPLYVLDVEGLPWSTYDLRHLMGGDMYLATGEYMRIHAYQLFYMYDATGYEPYRDLALAWEASAREKGVEDLPSDRE